MSKVKVETEVIKTKKEKFVEVCTPRVNKAVKAISLVGMCSASHYEYSPTQVESIINVMQTALDNVKSRFNGEKVSVAGYTIPEK